MAPRRGPPTPEEIRAWVEESCARQGLDLKITDREVLRRVAEILGSSRPPNRRKSRRVEVVPAPDGRTDHDRVQDGCHDRLPA